MRDDHPAASRGAELVDDVLVGETVEAVAPDTGVPQRARKREALRELGHVPVKCGVEADDLWKVGEPARDGFDRLELGREVQGSERHERLQRLEQSCVHRLGRAVQRAPVDHAMSDGIRCGKLVRVERGEGRLDRRPAVGNVDGALDLGVGPFSQGEACAGVADPLDCAGRERHLALPELVESELERRRAGVEAKDAKGRHAHTSDHFQSRTSGMSSK